MSAPAVPGMVYARAHRGMWIGDCPRPCCRSAAQLARYQPTFGCWDCPATGPVTWPRSAEDIERILMMRPDPLNRNWNPGETLIDLILENAAHGILDNAISGCGGSTVLFTITDGRITGGALAPALRTGQLARGWT